jgi:hypothetical protein
MKATRLTAEQLKNDDGREYNPQVWEDNIQRYISKYSDVEFFKAKKGDGYDYDRYFVVYTLPEGLRLLNTFGYSASLTNGGFQEALINSFDVDAMKPYDNNEVNIVGFKYKTKDDNGNIVDAWLNNSKNAREFMIDKSKRFGSIFTKQGIN